MRHGPGPHMCGPAGRHMCRPEQHIHAVSIMGGKRPQEVSTRGAAQAHREAHRRRRHDAPAWSGAHDLQGVRGPQLPPLHLRSGDLAVGTWMQMAAQSWLVLTLTGSATTLGLIVALQTLPILLLGPYGGVIADRVDKRRTDDLPAGRDGHPGADTRRADDRRRGAAVADRRARGGARRQQRLRESRASIVHARDGRPRAFAQRGQPQLGAGQRRARDRAGRRGRLDRDRRRSGSAS